MEPVTGRKGSFAAAAAFVLPPPEDELAEVATSHSYQVHTDPDWPQPA